MITESRKKANKIQTQTQPKIEPNIQNQPQNHPSTETRNHRINKTNTPPTNKAQSRETIKITNTAKESTNNPKRMQKLVFQEWIDYW